MRTTIKGLLFTVLFFVVIGACENYVDSYSREMTVLSVNENTVSLVDNYGELWRVETEDLVKDQKVKVELRANHTEYDLSDDVIVKIKPIEINLK